MTAQPLAGVARVIAEMVKGMNQLDPEVGKRVAAALAKNFKVKVEDVAILQLDSKGKALSFIVPEKLAKVGSIPMSSTRALAVRTLRDKRSECINNFTAAEHHTVFEGVPLIKGEGADPIQKILSVPVLAEKDPAGVLQVSRKGKSANAAGPDFTPKDVTDLTQVAAALAPCLKQG